MMTTKIKGAVLLVLGVNLMALGWLAMGVEAYMSFIIAAMSVALVVMGSLYAYARMVSARAAYVDPIENREKLQVIEDPHQLYEDEDEVDPALVEELPKPPLWRTLSAWGSIYRMIPYALFIIGVVRLMRTHTFAVIPYLIGVGAGVALGYMLARMWWRQE